VSEANETAAAAPSTEKTPKKAREIKGNLAYTVYPNALKKALDGMIAAERPDKFSSDFLGTILKITGGSARPIGPMLKKMQFISSDGTPTELYSKFKSDTARGQAALDGLRNAYGEMFKRNEFIHRADSGAVKDLIVEITGLNKSDNIVRLIFQTFDVLRGFADKGAVPSADTVSGATREVGDDISGHDAIGFQSGSRNIGLSYHINVVLPETENIAVFNAIFRSLRDNLLRDL
jgi:hypothetical protein